MFLNLYYCINYFSEIHVFKPNTLLLYNIGFHNIILFLGYLVLKVSTPLIWWFIVLVLCDIIQLNQLRIVSDIKVSANANKLLFSCSKIGPYISKSIRTWSVIMKSRYIIISVPGKGSRVLNHLLYSKIL